MKDILKEIDEVLKINEDYFLISDWDNITAQSYIEKYCPICKDNEKVIKSMQALFDSVRDNYINLRANSHNYGRFRVSTGFYIADIDVENDISFVKWDANTIKIESFIKVSDAAAKMQKFIDDWRNK